MKFYILLDYDFCCLLFNFSTLEVEAVLLSTFWFLFVFSAFLDFSNVPENQNHFFDFSDSKRFQTDIFIFGSGNEFD